jgi:hypothetical protein
MTDISGTICVLIIRVWTNHITSDPDDEDRDGPWNTSVIFNQLEQLIAWEDFIYFSYHESFTSYIVLFEYLQWYENINKTVLLVIFLTEIFGEETGVQDLLTEIQEELLQLFGHKEWKQEGY